MNSFGENLHVSNKSNFNTLWKDNLKQRFRKHISNFMMERKRENDFFDIDKFHRNYVKDMNITNDILNQIVIEINNLGWKTYIGFGGTGLYIYSSEDLPLGVY